MRDIAREEVDPIVLLLFGSERGATDLSLIDVDPDNRLLHSPFPEIKREQTDAAADIENRRLCVAEQVIGKRKRWIGTQFAGDVVTQPS